MEIARYDDTPPTRTDGKLTRPQVDIKGRTIVTGDATATAIPVTSTPATVGAGTAAAAARVTLASNDPLVENVANVTDEAAEALKFLAVDETGAAIDTSSPAQVTPGAPIDAWSYAAPTGGIDNTSTAVTVKTAAGSGVRNYVTGLDISHATLGAATEFAIRDGAGGTVLWRTLLHTTAMPIDTIKFDPPLVGTANTLLEIVTLTAVTGDVLVNVRGFSR